MIAFSFGISLIDSRISAWCCCTICTIISKHRCHLLLLAKDTLMYLCLCSRRISVPFPAISHTRAQVASAHDASTTRYLFWYGHDYSYLLRNGYHDHYFPCHHSCNSPLLFLSLNIATSISSTISTSITVTIELTRTLIIMIMIHDYGSCPLSYTHTGSHTINHHTPSSNLGHLNMRSTND